MNDLWWWVTTERPLSTHFARLGLVLVPDNIWGGWLIVMISCANSLDWPKVLHAIAEECDVTN